MGINMDLVLSDIGDDFQCFACIDLIQDGVMLRSCKHIFCRACINGLVENSENLKLRCPDCRKSFIAPGDVNELPYS